MSLFMPNIYAKYLIMFSSERVTLRTKRKMRTLQKYCNFIDTIHFYLFYILGIGSVNVLIISFLTKKITQK